MHKLFSTLATAAGGLVVLLAAWLYFNRVDTIDSQHAAKSAQIEIDQTRFDEQFAAQMGQPLSADQLKQNAETRQRLEQEIKVAAEQRASAQAKRQGAAKSLDDALVEWANRSSSSGPGWLSIGIAGFIVLLLGVGFRALTRQTETEDASANTPAALKILDRFIDKAMNLLPKRGAKQ